MKSMMTTELKNSIDKVARFAGDLEYTASDLERELDRLLHKLDILEDRDDNNFWLKDLIHKLYVEKISSTPEQFESFLKSFFLQTIDKRL